MEGVFEVNRFTHTENIFPVMASTTSPWGKIPTHASTPLSLHDVMDEQASEQLAQKMQAEEGTFHLSETGSEPSFSDIVSAASVESSDKTDNDLLLAQMLQMEYDKENDSHIKRLEKKVNGDKKVSISFENYRTVHPADRNDEEDDDCVDEEELENQKTGWENPSPNFKKTGTSGKGKNITTKHDAVICGRRNASKLMDLPPEFRCGDGEGMDMQLPNKVYNKLKMHSMSENKRSHKLHEKKEHSTSEHVLDARTKILLYKLVNNGTLESVSGSISTGKESVVYHAYGGSYQGVQLPEECAIKIYKTTLNEFKTREKYVHGDHRFSKDDFKKHKFRKIIKIWSEKETANLNRMKKFGIPCPNVQVLRKNVLVMTFIGKDQRPAPKLKDAKLSPQDLVDAYDQTVNVMKRMQTQCGLVHADLSEYNILWFNDKAWIIDVGQAVDLTHPRAMEFLFRDCGNISQFFQKNGVYGVESPETLFNDITGLNIKGKGQEFAAQVQRYDKEKSEELLAYQASHKEYAFDYYFEKSQTDKDYDEEIMDEKNDQFEYFYEKSLQDKAEELEEVSSDSDDEIEGIDDFVIVDKLNLG